ncbi:MAG: TIGR03621 family F420-dependent LLM class oxidoreductase [Nitrososphaerales archaeon]
MGSFRFGFQATATDPREVINSAQAAEAAGFHVAPMGDHLGAQAGILTTLSAVAQRTTRIRLCPLVVNNDLRHPVILAQELATLDHLSGGRLEVGIGAGHAFTEYEAIGQHFDPPAIRKARLAESVEVLRRLFDDGRVSYSGEHYQLREAATMRPLQDHVPMLVGVNGKVALAHAARHADIVAPTMLGRTLPDGQRHETRWEAARLDDTVAWIRHQAAERWDDLELHALVQSVIVTDDRQDTARRIEERTGMVVEDILSTPFLCIGTHEEMANHLRACRERWGISYYTTREIESFRPVIERLPP